MTERETLSLVHYIEWGRCTYCGRRAGRVTTSKVLDEVTCLVCLRGMVGAMRILGLKNRQAQAFAVLQRESMRRGQPSPPW